MGGADHDYIEDTEINSDGSIIYAVGSTLSYTYGLRDNIFLAFKTSGTGSLLFYKRYGCSKSDFL